MLLWRQNRHHLRMHARTRHLVALLCLIGLAAFGPIITPHSPIVGDLFVKLRGPSLAHPFGTDNLGRDLLSRLLAGARPTLGRAALAATGVLALTAILGVVSGSSRAAGKLMDGLCDILLALPRIVLALAIAGFLGPTSNGALFAVVLAAWAGPTKVMAANVRQIRALDFLDTARANGASKWRIAVHHVFPNAAPMLAVLGTVETGRLMVELSALSFLGLGVQPPNPEWGRMLNDARPNFERHPLSMFVPGVALTLSALVIHFAGDALRDRFDPASRSN